MERKIDSGPIDDSKQDIFGRSNLAEIHAKTIIELAQNEPSAVLALTGSWGVGKTSTWNLMRQHFETGWSIRELNAWNISDEERMQSEILRAISSEKGLLVKASALKLISNITTVFKDTCILTKLLAGLMNILPQRKSIEHLRENLQKRLKKKDERVLIVIDDVDRIDAEELVAVFRAVRSIGRLHKVYYLMIYDRERIDSLVQKTSFEGKEVDLIEKIVDLELAVPELSSSQIETYLKTLFCEYLDKNPELSYVNDLIKLALPFVNTPRKLKRLRAVLAIDGDSFKEDIDLRDRFITVLMSSVDVGIVKTINRLVHYLNPKIISLASAFQFDARSNVARECYEDTIEQTIRDEVSLSHYELAMRAIKCFFGDELNYEKHSKVITANESTNRILNPLYSDLYLLGFVPADTIGASQLTAGFKSLREGSVAGVNQIQSVLLSESVGEIIHILNRFSREYVNAFSGGEICLNQSELEFWCAIFERWFALDIDGQDSVVKILSNIVGRYLRNTICAETSNDAISFSSFIEEHKAHALDYYYALRFTGDVDPRTGMYTDTDFDRSTYAVIAKAYLDNFTSLTPYISFDGSYMPSLFDVIALWVEYLKSASYQETLQSILKSITIAELEILMREFAHEGMDFLSPNEGRFNHPDDSGKSLALFDRFFSEEHKIIIAHRFASEGFVGIPRTVVSSEQVVAFCKEIVNRYGQAVSDGSGHDERRA